MTFRPLHAQSLLAPDSDTVSDMIFQWTLWYDQYHDEWVAVYGYEDEDDNV